MHLAADVAFTTELFVSELVTNAIRYGGPPVRLTPEVSDPGCAPRTT
jgi:two-component sensor histidine kinase